MLLSIKPVDIDNIAIFVELELDFGVPEVEIVGLRVADRRLNLFVCFWVVGVIKSLPKCSFSFFYLDLFGISSCVLIY